MIVHRVKKNIVFGILALFIIFFTASSAVASQTLGIIDPNGVGNYLVQLVHDPSAASNDDEINFGKFTTQSAYNITVSDNGLRGFAWGGGLGWIVTNCLDTISGCSGVNGNFKVAVADDGTLSGFAWGETAGWINFGPFTNSATEQVQIDANGVFGGTSTSAGYAWSQNFGWMKFDCSNASSCVVTDYVPVNDRTNPQCADGIDNDGDGKIDYPGDPGCSSASDNDESNTTTGGGGGNVYACSDGIDNDGDGLIDYPDDPGCQSASDNDETNTIITPPSQCSDGIDNDGDGKIDFPNDSGCTSFVDNDEYNTVDGIGDDGGDGDGSGGGSGGGSTSDGTTSGGGGIQPEEGNAPSFAAITAVAKGFSLAGAVSALLVGIFSALLDNPFILNNLWSLLLAIFGYRKKHWGVVYDSQTKQPIDPAYVVLSDMVGKEIATCITDLEGRYGFLVAPGTYTMQAQKTHYAFPSVRLASKDRDAVYSDLYFGEPIVVVKKDQTVLKNIPLDPIAVDWNETAKRDQGLLSFYSRHEPLFRMLSTVLFSLGFLFSIVAYVISPVFWNLFVICFYLFIFVLEHMNVLKPRTANVVDARGTGLPYALVEIYNAHIGQKIATKVTSAYGRFLGLVPKGTYYVKILQRDSLETETYTPIHTTESFDARRGYIERKITIPEKE